MESSSPMQNTQTMQKPLSGLKTAILVANGFNETEMTMFQRGMLEAGAYPKIISVENSLANGWQGNTWGHYFAVDCQLADALSADYDILVVPGGQRSLDKLKLTAHTKRFIGGFLAAMKPIMLVGDAPLLLAYTGQAQNLMLTAAPEAKDTLTQAGAVWSDDTPTIHYSVISGTAAETQGLAELVQILVNFTVKLNAERDLEQQAA